MTGREYHWKIADRDVAVRIEESNGKGLLYLEERKVPFVLSGRDSDGGWIELDGKNQRFYLHRDRENFSVWLRGHTYRLERIEKGRSVEHAAATSSDIRALMPGKILRIDVAVGDVVTERQSAVIMESMKMESALVTPRAGKVTAIHCQAGQVVEMGALLVSIE